MFSLKRVELLALGLVVGVSLLLVIVGYAGTDKVLAAFSTASPIYIALAAGTTAAPFMARALRWRILLASVKEGVRVDNAFWITTVGFLVNAAVPTRVVGEAVRAFLMDRIERTGFLQSLASVAVERLLDLWSIVTLGLVGLILVPQPSSQLAWLLDGLRVAFFLIVLGLSSVMLGTWRRAKTMQIIDGILGLLPLGSGGRKRLRRYAGSILEGASGLSRRPSAFAVTLLLTIAIWLAQFLTVYFAFHAFGYEQATVAVALLGSMLFTIASVIPLTPGYIGTYETFWVFIFRGLGLTRLDLVIAAALVAHLVDLAVVSVTGGLGITRLGLSFREILRTRPGSSGAMASSMWHLEPSIAPDQWTRRLLSWVQAALVRACRYYGSRRTRRVLRECLSH